MDDPLPKLFRPTVRRKCSSDREKHLKFEAEGQEFANFEITRTICSKSEIIFCYRILFHLFLEVSLT